MKHPLKSKILNAIVSIALILSACSKDEAIENVELKNTAEWSFIGGYILTGEYVKGKEIEDGANYIEISVQVTKGGSYNLSTEMLNGYQFSGQGELTDATNQRIKLFATGTPQSAGADEFVVSIGEASRNFTIEVIPIATEELNGKMVINSFYDSWSNKGSIYAYRAVNGTVMWSESNLGYVSHADIHADTLFFSNSTGLEARAVASGDMIWSVSNEESIGFAGVTYYNGALYCNTNSGEVVAFKSSDGSLVHRYSLETASGIRSIPTIVNDVIYVGGDALFAFNLDGSQKWKYDAPDYIYSGPTVDNGMVYFTASNGILYALNAANGTLIWQHDMGATGGLESLTVNNDKVYAGANDLYCLNASNGELVWVKENVNMDVNGPTVFNNAVYVNGGDYTYSLDAETGEQNWELFSNYKVNSEIVACESFIVYNTSRPLARYVENGDRIWSGGDSETEPSAMHPLIYDVNTKMVYYSSVHGNKK